MNSQALDEWVTNRWLLRQPAAKSEIAELLELADRDLAECTGGSLGTDWLFAIAYNATLQLARAALAAAGYATPKGESHHFRALQSLQHTIGVASDVIDRLDRFRRKRSATLYERVGAVSPSEAAAMLHLATDLRARVGQWLAANYPNVNK